MSSHLKNCERERKLEKIRGKAKNGSRRKRAPNRDMSPTAFEHFSRRGDELDLLFAGGDSDEVLYFDVSDAEIKRFPEIKPWVLSGVLAVDITEHRYERMDPGVRAGLGALRGGQW